MEHKIAKALLSVCIIILAEGTAMAKQSEHLTYPEFITAVKQGQVKSVELYQSTFGRIDGVYLKNEGEKKFQTRTKVGSADDPLLVKLLEEKGVIVTITGKPKSPLLLLPIFLLWFGIPIAVLVLLIKINSKLNRLIQSTDPAASRNSGF